MPKIIGPLLSLGASGGLGENLAFARIKGGYVLKTKARQSYTRTDKQIAHSACFLWLQSHWPTLSDALKATWEAPAAAAGMTPQNFYCSYNLQRWTHFKSNFDEYGIPEANPSSRSWLFNPTTVPLALNCWIQWVSKGNCTGVRFHWQPGTTCAYDNSTAKYWRGMPSGAYDQFVLRFPSAGQYRLIRVTLGPAGRAYPTYSQFTYTIPG